MNNQDFSHIPAEKFRLATGRDVSHDKAPETKPVGFFKDAWLRFKRNKGSVVAAIIIILLLLFAILAPIFSQYTVAYEDADMAYCYPKTSLSEALGWDFWDGCVEKEQGENGFSYLYAIGVETPNSPIKNQKYSTYELNGKTMYKYRFDTYRSGILMRNFTEEEYLQIQQYQNETGVQVIYPITVKKLRPVPAQDLNDGNYWYKTKVVNGKTIADLNENGDYENIYDVYTGVINPATQLPYDMYTSTVYAKDEDGNRLYKYARKVQGGWELRVDYYEYYIFRHAYQLKDGITKPLFLFGTTNYGKDIFTCVASGARLSFLVAIVICVINMIVGTIYGAIEGYYGGAADLIMERISDILSAVPTMIVITLLQHNLEKSSPLLILFIAFFATGWIGMASRVRMQFYRFKNQEYVLASRTLGARDFRVMFKHIFPNSLGTIITGTVLVIPSFIFSEANLSYLGIINLSTGNLTSVGTILSMAQPFISTYPYMMLSPAIFISLLLLAFNLFGNGLRDAFNPSLRGTEA